MITLYKFKDSNHTEYFIQMHEDKSLTIEYSKYGGAFEKRFLHNYEYDRKLPDLQKRLIRVFDQNTSSDILNERLQFTSFIPRSAGSEISQGLQNYQSNLAKVYLNCPFTGFDFSTLSLNEWVDNQFSYQLADFQRVTQGNSRTNRWRLNIDMQVADEELRLLADVLSKAPFVKEVFFSSSDRLTSEALVSFIGSNQTVEELAFINAGDNLVEALPEVLKKDPFLKSLRISSSKMISKGAKALFEALKTNTHLEFLELTKFGNDELVVKNLGGIFRENKSLRSLQFEECILEVSSACTLANALECNRTIESVTLGNTWLSQVALSNFAKAIAANSESRLSSFSMNVEWIPHLSQDCLKEAAEAFGCAYRLERIRIAMWGYSKEKFYQMVQESRTKFVKDRWDKFRKRALMLVVSMDIRERKPGMLWLPPEMLREIFEEMVDFYEDVATKQLFQEARRINGPPIRAIEYI